MPEPESSRSGCLQQKRNHSPGRPVGPQHKKAHDSEGSNWGAQQARWSYLGCQQHGSQDWEPGGPLETDLIISLFAHFQQRLHFRSFSKDAGISLSTSMKLRLISSSKPDENGTLPNQPPSQQIRHKYHLLANTISAEIARNWHMIWKLANQKHTWTG